MWIELDGAPTSAADLVRRREQLWRARLSEGSGDSDVIELDVLLRLRGVTVVEANDKPEPDLG